MIVKRVKRIEREKRKRKSWFERELNTKKKLCFFPKKKSPVVLVETPTFPQLKMCQKKYD
jgi:hypothetical protein